MKTALRMLSLALLFFAVSGVAQTPDTSALRPPKGARMAIVVFEDLECPQCARIEPLLDNAVKAYKVPLVRYDFPLQMHPWSYTAHVMARYFDSKSKDLGEEFRRWIFANQNGITKLNLRSMGERFATEHHQTLPAFLDPNGEFAKQIQADQEVGRKVGIDHTPTVYVVSTSPTTPVIEVKDVAQLFSTLDQVKAQLPAQTAPASKASGKGGARKTP